MKIIWMKDGLHLSSGFYVSKDEEPVSRFVDEIRTRADLSIDSE